MADDFWGEPIYSYTRAQAIDDGMLIDVSETAREAGISFPTVVTLNLWETYIMPSKADAKLGQDMAGRLWDTVFMAVMAMKQARGKSRVQFKVSYMVKGKQTQPTLIAACGPGDTAAPVITIMLPDDD